MKARSGYATIILLWATGNGYAQDIRGSRDHPRISRFRGSSIVQYDNAEFGELTIPLSNPTSKPPVKVERVEGRISKILYRISETASSHEVFRSYEQELTAAGFRTLYRCSGETQCGHGRVTSKIRIRSPIEAPASPWAWLTANRSVISQ